MVQRTLVIIKPDGVKNGWLDPIWQRFVDIGLVVVEKYYGRFQEKSAREFYTQHEGAFHFWGNIIFICGGDCHALILEGENAVELARKLCGEKSSPMDNPEGTIRRDFRSSGGPANTVHSSDSYESFLREYPIIKKAFARQALEQFRSR